MAKKIKFAPGATTKKTDVIDQEVKKLPTKTYKEKDPDTEEQMTIQAYRELVARLAPEIKLAKRKGGLIAKTVKVNGNDIIKYETCNVATIATREGLAKEEVQQIWDMV